jgi:hypothetical protein
LELEEEQWRRCGATEDFNGAIKSFMERKPPVFRGKYFTSNKWKIRVK